VNLMDALLLQYVDPYYIHIMVLIGINLILTLGLNITTGVTGQLSMGHAGFMSIGAYVSAICTIHFGLPFWAVLIAGAVAAALFGFLLGIPTLRLEGDYLAMVTIGFAEIVRVFFLNFEPGGKAVGLSAFPSKLLFHWSG
jgi:branched-chain amino acid transport system permease protein